MFGGGGVVIASGYGVSFSDEEDVLELDSRGGSCKILQIYDVMELYSQRVNFLVYELQLK